MTTMTARQFPEQLDALAGMLYRKIESEPEYLLEHDTGEMPDFADAYIARLIGLEDEIVEQWLIRRPTAELHLPVASSASFLAADAEPTLDPITHTYVLQSNYATATVSADPAWTDFLGDPPPTFQYKIAVLRYRRRR